MITQLKAIGMPLKEIAEILRRRDIRYFYGMVERQAAGIEERIRQLQSARRAAEHLLATCGSCLAKPILDELSIQEIGPRRLLRFDIEAYPLSGGAGADQASGALDAWERCLRQVKRIFVDNDLPLSLFSNVGCLIRREDLAARNFVVSGAFIFVDADFACPVDMRVQNLPGGPFLAVCCDGMSTPEVAHLESQYLARLFDWIEERGYALAGDYFGEVLAETPAFLYSGRDMMVRLQIPVIPPPGS